MYPDHNIFIPPCPDDSGIAIGAAIVGLLESGEKLVSLERRDYTYTGTEYSDGNISEILNNMKVNYRQREGSWKEVAMAIAEGKIVGIFQGKSEFGQRALGNRSIVADPRYRISKQRLNSAIKFREEFRPFAPSVIKERGSEVFEE